MREVKRKILVLALAVAMLAVPVSAVLAPKPEPILFYGYPLLPAEAEQYYAGNSDNLFNIWTALGWEFCWDYDVMTLPGDPPMDIAVPTDIFAEGFYDGRWIFHKYVPGDPLGTFKSINTRGIHTVTVTDWNGETGEFVLQGVGGHWTIISGTIGGMKLHGGGTVEQVEGLLIWKYEGTVHFTP